MGKTTVFITVVKETENEYVLGRINGMLAAFTDDHYAMIKVKYNDESVMLVRTRGTMKNYLKAKKVIERHYPNKCEFDMDAFEFIKEES